MENDRIAVLIPCRMESLRFPGKPLAPIHGIPMVVRCAQNAIKSGYKSYICTDSRIVEQSAKLYGMPVMLTPKFETGTDRVAWASTKIAAELIINLQGDEPLVNGEAINKFGEQCIKNCVDDSTILNGVCILDPSKAFDPNNVKVAAGESGRIVYLSRKAVKSFDSEHGLCYVKQIGLYGFTKSALDKFSRMAQSPLEKSEKVEMLRWIESGNALLSCSLDCASVSVDTPEDLVEAEQILINSQVL